MVRVYFEWSILCGNYAIDAWQEADVPAMPRVGELVEGYEITSISWSLHEGCPCARINRSTWQNFPEAEVIERLTELRESGWNLNERNAPQAIREWLAERAQEE